MSKRFDNLLARSRKSREYWETRISDELMEGNWRRAAKMLLEYRRVLLAGGIPGWSFKGGRIINLEWEDKFHEHCEGVTCRSCGEVVCTDDMVSSRECHMCFADPDTWKEEDDTP
jgi:hypothetical protein